MTLFAVVFHPAVEGDLAAAYAHYHRIDPELPARFLTMLGDQIERLSLFPESGAPVFEGYRRVLVKRFPYLAVYRVIDGRVEVLALVSTRRDPDSIEATLEERDVE